ncbi:Phosphorylated carbohydrates phosphatase [Candidatus Rhabdochlamydia oedothoracis]|uniref:Phosphorylated carbohydrates phosphatase n=1 Tax=Candidatus Rhabdochlamydia oedothoracis TaxID=2720720 RepID=A0ABX8V590_9BACT|nr:MULTISPECIES: HAD family phosphatase [Rhabdochlamydia]KAG6559565.1 Phosphorylated carbohydrates phosphatase [Candidatus Rhabdochlamydia sp. W815]QYF48399.1 Phosphorylated carbohydrates phosphatase [Candidatus Rhabdochlamydia oedothoracis]
MFKKLFDSYDIILFDFDGLLVDTEPLHFLAYREMCSKNEICLNWDFVRFCQEAHSSAFGIWKAFQKEFPTLLKKKSKEVLYQEKKEIYQELLKTTILKLMPGVHALLQALAMSNTLSAVVTNSALSQVEPIRKTLPILNVIPLWITREDYPLAKPAPDGYLQAIEQLGRKERIIGFEDTLKGIHALQAAKVEAVLVNPICPEGVKGFIHLDRIDHICLNI